MANSTLTDVNPTFSCPSFGASIFGECNGNGVCVNETTAQYPDRLGRCECDEGYTGLGDFIDGTGLACNINVNIISYLWLVLSFIYLGSGSYIAHKLWGQVQDNGRKKCFAKKVNVVMSVGVACSVLRFIEGWYRFLSKDRKGGHAAVGSDWVLTILSTLAGMMFWGYLLPHMLQEWMKVCVASAKMDREKGEELSAKIKSMSHGLHLIFYITVPSYMVMVVPLLFKDNITVQTIAVLVYYLGHSILGVYLCLIVALPVAVNFTEILKNSNPDKTDEKLNALTKKMEFMVSEIKKNATSNLLSCLLMCLPFMWNMATYQLWFGWFLGGGILFLAAYVVMPNRKGVGGKVSPSTAATVVE